MRRLLIGCCGLVAWGGVFSANTWAAGLPPTEIAKRVANTLSVDLGNKAPAAKQSAQPRVNAEGKKSDSAPTAAPAAEARIVDDEVFLRRVSLDIIGQPPTPAEVTAFALDTSANKREQAVKRLLADPRFGENWARYWRDVIMYRRTEERALIAAPALTKHLTENFNKNTPWDVVARGFVVATGNVQENGDTGLIMAQVGQPVGVAAEVSRIFMGVQIQCAECHDHPTDRWKREQFHELTAFFPRVAVRPVMADGQRRGFEIASNDRQRAPQNKGNLRRGEPEHHMPDLNNPSAKGKLMQPVFFVTNQKLEPGQDDVDRRQALANWMTAKSNPWFAKAFVNRLWAELVGEGFYEPIDDLGPDRQCSAPKTLELLANQFVAANYDVKWLFQSITATDAYQRESRSRRNPEQGAPFAANCPQRLRADQLYDSLAGALGIVEPPAPPAADGRPALQALARGPRGEFIQTFGFDPSNPREEETGSIPQALLLMNSPVVNRAIDAARGGSMLGRLLASTKEDEAVVVELYLRCLAREPRAAEVKTCLDHVRETGDRGRGFEDVLWALVNSTEFLHRR